MGLVWSVSLLFSSGVGGDMQVYGKAEIIFCLYAVYLWFRAPARQRASLPILLSGLLALGGLQLYGYEQSGELTLDYLFAFLVTWIFSRQELPVADVRLTGLLYGALGFAVLFVYNFMSHFSGWNENAIGMVCFFSFAVFLSAGFNPRKPWHKVLYFGCFFGYFTLLAASNSRGAALFSIITLLGIYRILPFRWFHSSRGALLLSLLVPLLVAVAVCSFAAHANMGYWDLWSTEHWGKPLFNGRDRLWEYGFGKLAESPLLGTGDLGMDNWHNSAVTCLVGYGALGFCAWLSVFYHCLNKARPYLADPCTYALFLCFLLIYWQQTVELGFIAPQVFLIPYAILGLLLARVRYLRQHLTPSAHRPAS